MYINRQAIDNFPDGQKTTNVILGIFNTDSHGVNKGHY
jgi:hypothetical protein